MDPDRQREIARKGGKAAHEKGTAHQFTSEEARQAGRKGGQVVSQHREHMVEIGRSGGRARRRRRRSDTGDNAQPGSERSSMPMNRPEGERRGSNEDGFEPQGMEATTAVAEEETSNVE
jgi:general stress protein YciG